MIPEEQRKVGGGGEGGLEVVFTERSEGSYIRIQNTCDGQAEKGGKDFSQCSCLRLEPYERKFFNPP